MNRGDIEPEDAAHQLARASKAHALQLAQQDGRQRSPSPSDGSDIMDVIQQPTGVPEVCFLRACIVSVCVYFSLTYCATQDSSADLVAFYVFLTPANSGHALLQACCVQVVFGTGKSPDQLAASLEAIATRQRVVLGECCFLAIRFMQ